MEKIIIFNYFLLINYLNLNLNLKIINFFECKFILTSREAYMNVPREN